jgi:hypothetical protein
VKYTDNNISRDMLGNSVDDIAVEVAAKSVISPGVANVSGGTRRQETVEQRSTVVEANVQTFFTHLASKPAAAQAFVQGVNGNSAVANPAFEHAQQLLQSATRLSPADQAEVVRSILADRTVSQGLGLTATAASVTPENAGALLQSVVEASTREPLKTIGAVSAIARNPRASAVLVGGLAGQPQLASSLSGTLQPAQQAEIITKANLENTNVWTSIAPQTTTHTTVRTTQVADFTNVRGAEGFVSAARQTEPRAQAVAFAKEALTNQSTRAEALESVIERDPKFATAAVVQTLSQDSELANDVLRNLRREGGRKHPGLLGWRKLTSSHPQAKLAGLIDDVLDARNDQDRAKAAEKLDAMLNSDKPDDKAAVADFFAAAQNTTTRSGVNGGDALRTTLVNALDGSQVNPNVPPLANFSLTGDQTVALLFNSALTLDNTNASDLAQSTFEFIGRSMTRTGFIIPYIPIITTREKPPIDQDVPRDQVPCCEPVPPRPRPLPEQNPGLPQPQGRQ